MIPLLMYTATQFFEAGNFEKAALLYAEEGKTGKEIESLYFAGKASSIVKKLEARAPEGDELYYLALAFQDLGDEPKMVKAGEAYLKSEGIDPQKKEALKTHLQLKTAEHLIAEKRFEAADSLLSELPPTAEILYTRIRLKEAQKEASEAIKPLKEALLSSQPQTPYHAAIAFEEYSFQDYLLGKKEALRHLKEFLKTYPDAPESSVAWYLTGLDLKRDRKGESGRRIHAKNLEGAIEAFHKAETLKTDASPYFAFIQKRATLERAHTLVEIAEEAARAKKHIYLSYAADVLQPLEGPEARLLLAHVFLLDDKKGEAYALLHQLESDFRKEGALQDRYFATTLLEKGKLLYEMRRAQEALVLLDEGEKQAPLGSLSSDELLGARITKALCYRDLKEYDTAMLVLSDVVNSDYISPLRIKAMYLRALIYESQGRPELAKRQFEAVLSKGGQWAEKAQEIWRQEVHE